jgi:hypothetical protein
MVMVSVLAMASELQETNRLNFLHLPLLSLELIVVSYYKNSTVEGGPYLKMHAVLTVDRTMPMTSVRDHKQNNNL